MTSETKKNLAVPLRFVLHTLPILGVLGCLGGPKFDSLDHLANMEVPDSLSNKAAVVLLEEDVVEIHNGSAVIETRLVKKILKPGNPEEGNFKFNEDKFRNVLSLRARAIYPDGREKTIFLDDLEPFPDFGDFELYSEDRAYAFRFPGLKAGTVIQLHVKRRVNNLLFLDPALFQRNIPIITRRYVLLVPDDMEYSIHAANMRESPDTIITLKDGRKKLVWEAHHIEAFEYEERMPNISEFIPVLEFSFDKEAVFGIRFSTESWNGIATWFEKLSRNSLKAGPRIKAMVRELCTPGMSDEEKARIIFADVEQKLRYVIIYLGLDGYRPHKAEDIVDKLYGDCKDQSVVLISALREAGIEAYPVLVRTADNGHPPNVHPTPTYFNHVITAAVVANDTIFLDPTCSICSYDELPFDDQGADALIVSSKSDRLVRLPIGKPRPNRRSVRVYTELKENGDARIRTRIEADGFYAPYMRGIFSFTEGKTKEEVAADKLLPDLPNIKLDSLTIDGLDLAKDRVSITMICRAPALVDSRKSFVSLPVVFDPVYLYLPDTRSRGASRSSAYECTIELPSGWAVAALPDPLMESNGYFEYRCSWETKEHMVHFSREWTLKKGLIPPSEIESFRSKLKSVLSVERSTILVSKSES
jgi:hypothetical protein